MSLHEVVTAQSTDAAVWDEAIARLPGGSFYHRFAWRDVNEAALGLQSHYLMMREGTRITGALPLTLLSSRLFGRILCSMPFVNFGGPCSEDEARAKALVDAAVEVARERDVDYMELRCCHQLDCDLPASRHKVSFSVSLEPDPERVKSAFSSKHRNTLRRAQKNGLEVESGGGSLLPEFYAVMERAWHELGTPLYGPGYFERVMQEFRNEVLVFVCRRNGRAVAAALNGIFGGTVEGMWNGATGEARGLLANYVLYWEMIRYACERGFSRFHLGRSTIDSGAQEFKSKWNAIRTPLHFYHWRPDGSEAAGPSADEARFRLASAAWRRLPRAVVRHVGPRLARSIP